MILGYRQSAVFDWCQKWKWSWETSYGVVLENVGRCICCSPVTTLSEPLQCIVAEVCALPSAVYSL